MADDKVSKTQQFLRQGTVLSRGPGCQVSHDNRLPFKTSQPAQGEAQTGFAMGMDTPWASEQVSEVGATR